MKTRILFIALLLLLIPVSLLLGYGYTHSQHADHGWDIVLYGRTFIDTHPRVVIDRAHDNAHTARGRYRPFATLLDMDGFDVESGRDGFSAKSLEKTDALVIVNASGGGHRSVVGINLPFSDDQREQPAFTADEIEAVRAWVERGGSLLLIADHSPYGSASAPMAAAFGVTMYQGFTEIPDEKSDPLEFSRANGRLPDHPIVAGRDSTSRVEKIFTFTGQSLDGPDHATVLLSLPDHAIEYIPERHEEEGRTEMHEAEAGGAQGLAFEYGQGRVVVLGEAAMLTAQVLRDERFGMNTPGCDNQQFALNVMHWLVRLI